MIKLGNGLYIGEDIEVQDSYISCVFTPFCFLKIRVEKYVFLKLYYLKNIFAENYFKRFVG